MGFLWRSYKVKFSFTPRVFLLEVGWEVLVSWPFFPPPHFRLLIFPFILACVHYSSSTYRVYLSKADTCPITPYSKSLGMVVKAKECGSVRFRTLNGSKSSFPWIFLDLSSKFQSYTVFTLLSGGDFGSAED